MKKSNKLIRKLSSIIVLTAILGAGQVANAEETDYAKGQKQLDQQNWRGAEKTFKKITSDDNKNDAALYWLAYSQSKNNQYQNALNTISKLKKNFSKSQWIDDANALRAEIKDHQGDAAEISDDEMKLYAIDSLLSSSSERSIEILSKIIKGKNTDRVKKRAIFVLSQSPRVEAFNLLSELAKDSNNGVLQLYAIDTLGMSGSENSLKLLKEIYKGQKQKRIKTKILKGFMVADEGATLLSIARTEKDADLRRQAVRLLGMMGQAEDLMVMYKDSKFKDEKGAIIDAIAIGGGAVQIFDIIATEEDEQLVIEAIKKVGIIDHKKTGDGLAKLYRSKASKEIKSAVIRAMFIQGNAAGIIEILKNETDNELKRQALKTLSMIDSDEVIEFFSKSLN